MLANITLSATLTEQDDAGCLVIQTSENKKKSLSPYSLAITYEKLMLDLNISQNELSRRLGMPKTSFSELMSFNKVPREVWMAVGDMTNVKPRTAAFIALTCSKSEEYLSAILKASSKIRDGYGSDNLAKVIDKYMSNTKSNRNASRIYESKAGEVLFRVTSEGRISLSKIILKKIDMEHLTNYIGDYIENIS